MQMKLGASGARSNLPNVLSTQFDQKTGKIGKTSYMQLLKFVSDTQAYIFSNTYDFGKRTFGWESWEKFPSIV